jgi:predicted MFS family arabinose efflux permease
LKPREEGLISNNIKPIETQTPHMVSSTIVIGLGSTMLNISLVNIVIFSVERSSLGTAAGLNTVFRNLGSAWGPAVAGTIMDQFKDTLLLLTSPLYRFKYNLTLHIN